MLRSDAGTCSVKILQVYVAIDELKVKASELSPYRIKQQKQYLSVNLQKTARIVIVQL